MVQLIRITIILDLGISAFVWLRWLVSKKTIKWAIGIGGGRNCIVFLILYYRWIPVENVMRCGGFLDTSGDVGRCSTSWHCSCTVFKSQGLRSVALGI